MGSQTTGSGGISGGGSGVTTTLQDTTLDGGTGVDTTINGQQGGTNLPSEGSTQDELETTNLELQETTNEIGLSTGA